MYMLRNLFYWFRNNYKILLLITIVIMLCAFLWHKYSKSHTCDSDKSQILLPSTEKVIIVQPQGEQDVIIIGDPDKIQVKPKKNIK